MKILGIETSCDETAAAVVELLPGSKGCCLLSNVVASSVDLHAKYGGVVPEIAARSHIESIIPIINEALFTAKYGQAIGLDEVQGSKQKRANRTNGTESESRTQLTQQFAKNTLGKAGFAWLEKSVADSLWDQIDGIAVTNGAGLGGSLLVGVMTARTLAIIKKKPLYAINHVEAHLYANFITSAGSLSPASGQNPKHSKSGPADVKEWKLIGQTSNNYNLEPRTYNLRRSVPAFPMLGLIVSGGHTQLVLFKNHFDYRLLGQTRDDAIGEAFDKVAKMLGLPYPGGPSVAEAAKKGDSFAFNFPKAKLDSKYNFSFSGLKTAVLRTAQAEIGEDYAFPSQKLPDRLSDVQKANVAASFQRIAIETVVDKTVAAYEEFVPKSVIIGGGVAASTELREQLIKRLPCPINYQDIKLMGDNGAMVATLGCFKMKLNQKEADPFSLEIQPNLSM